jgi:hypothetical protein
MLKGLQITWFFGTILAYVASILLDILASVPSFIQTDPRQKTF